MGKLMKQISIGGAIAIVLSVFFFGTIGVDVNAGTGDITSKATGYERERDDRVQGEAQKVLLKFENYQYKLEPSELQKGVPVRMEVDLDSVYGCMRDIVIPSFGVDKYVREGNNIIEFTPTKSGTFNIQCSMNMGRGKFSVVKSDGSKSAYVEEAENPAAGATCGSSGGGSCGCGAR